MNVQRTVTSSCPADTVVTKCCECWRQRRGHRRAATTRGQHDRRADPEQGRHRGTLRRPAERRRGCVRSNASSRGSKPRSGPVDISEWPAEGKPYGPAETRETLTSLRTGAPDLAAEIEHLLAEDDQVVAWVRMTGTMTGLLGPASASGRHVDFHHAHRFRLRDGLIVEHWAVRDDLRGMIQARVVMPPGRPTG
jgi:predicted ester cyclase